MSPTAGVIEARFEAWLLVPSWLVSFNLTVTADEDTAEMIRQLRGTRVLGSLDGTLFALFDSTGRLTRTMNDNPDWVLERVVETVG